jgi:hypothetical protein
MARLMEVLQPMSGLSQITQFDAHPTVFRARQTGRLAMPEGRDVDEHTEPDVQRCAQGG